MLTRATAKGWSDGLIKIVTGVGGLLGILIVLNNTLGWSIGGLMTGNQVSQGDQKHQLDDIQNHIKSIDDTIKVIPTTLQEIANQAREIASLITEQNKLRDRMTDDERSYDSQVADLKARVGRIEGTPSAPDIRQPRRQ